MRLIDADAFKELLGTDTKIRETFCKVIDAQPTAYDVEKIVAELEEASHWEDSTFDEDGYCNDDAEEVIYLHRAIDIVKMGGAK